MSTTVNTLDIRTVNKDMLVDADDIFVDIDAPKIERMTSMAEQMKGNPYFFKCKKEDGSGYIAVQVAHIETEVTVNDRAESWMRTM